MSQAFCELLHSVRISLSDLRAWHETGTAQGLATLKAAVVRWLRFRLLDLDLDSPFLPVAGSYHPSLKPWIATAGCAVDSRARRCSAGDPWPHDCRSALCVHLPTCCLLLFVHEAPILAGCTTTNLIAAVGVIDGAEQLSVMADSDVRKRLQTILTETRRQEGDQQP